MSTLFSWSTLFLLLPFVPLVLGCLLAHYLYKTHIRILWKSYLVENMFNLIVVVVGLGITLFSIEHSQAVLEGLKEIVKGLLSFIYRPSVIRQFFERDDSMVIDLHLIRTTKLLRELVAAGVGTRLGIPPFLWLLRSFANRVGLAANPSDPFDKFPVKVGKGR